LVILHPEEYWSWFQLAPLLIVSGDLAGYRQHREAMLARFGATADPLTGERIAKACLLLPMTGEDLTTASRMADTAVTVGKDHRFLASFQLAKGLAEYRQGRFASALEWTEKALAKAGNNDQRDAQCYVVLAIAHHRSSQTNEALVALGKAVEIVEPKPPRIESGDLTDEWPHRLISQILLREAKTLIGGVSGVSVPEK
jgi:tetratricopeptide (TPR) repeat protein